MRISRLAAAFAIALILASPATVRAGELSRGASESLVESIVSFVVDALGLESVGTTQEGSDEFGGYVDPSG